MPSSQPQQPEEEQQQQQQAEMRGEGQGKPLYHHHRYNLRHRFELGRTLGTGTYGKVKHAVEKSSSEEVAIKHIKKTKIQDEADLNRIRREIRILSRLNHPHIVNVREVFEKKDRIILVMDCALGGELYEYVASRQQVDLEEARRIFLQIAQALHYAHQQGVVHRDLKLENIILDQDHNVKVADFGLANFYQKGELLHTFCGSPLYASPEIVNGTPYRGPEVDIWSMGVVLYTLVHGSMPFESSNLKALRNQISAGLYFEPPSLTEADPLIRHMLRVDPEERASMEEVLSHPWLTAQTPPRPLAPLEDPHNPLQDTPCPETSFDEDEALFDIGRCKSPLELELEVEEEAGEEDRKREEQLLPDPGEEDVFPSCPGDLPPPYPDLQRQQQQEEEMTTAFCREDVGVYGEEEEEEEEEEEFEDEEVNAIFPEESLPPGGVVLGDDVSPGSPESGTESGEAQAGSDVSNSGDETSTTRKVFDSERKPRRGILKRRGKFSGGDSGCILQDADPYFCRAEDMDPTPTLQPQLAPQPPPPPPHLAPDLSPHPFPAHASSSSLGATTPSSVLPSHHHHQPNPDFLSADDFSQLLLPAAAAAGLADAAGPEPEPGCPSNSAPSVCTCSGSRQQSSSSSGSSGSSGSSAVVMRRRGILKRSGQQAADPKKRLSVGSTSSNSSADLLDLSYDSGEGEQFLAVLAAQGGNNGSYDPPCSAEGSCLDTPRDVEGGMPPPCLPPGGYQPRFPLEMYEDLEGRPEVPDTYVPRFPPEMYELLLPGERERAMTPREGVLEGEGELEEAGDLETPGHPEMLQREGCGLAIPEAPSTAASTTTSSSSSSLPYKPRFPPECYSDLGEGETTGYRPRFPPEMYNLSDSAPSSSSFPLRYSPGLFSESLLARPGSGQEESGDLAGARRRLRELRLFLARHPHPSQRAGGDLAALNLAGEGEQWGGGGRLGRRPDGGQQQLELDNADVLVKALEICSRVR